jgi:hypothetical protein
MIGVVARVVANGITRVRRLKMERKKSKADSRGTVKRPNC